MFTVHMDELIKELQSAGIGCYVGHEYFGCFSYADDMKLLYPSIKGLQQMIEICERFGVKYSLTYNAKKSVCMVYYQFVDRSVQFNDSINIMLNESRLIWSNCVKHLGNYIKYDLSEYEEILYKNVDYIWRVNGLCIKYQDAVPEVKMHLLNTYCCHFYGSQAWSFNDKNIKYIINAWNRAVRKIWNFNMCFK